MLYLYCLKRSRRPGALQACHIFCVMTLLSRHHCTSALVVRLRTPHSPLAFGITEPICWHHFLTRVKEGDFCEEKVADLEETKRCTVLESVDGVRPMDQRNMLWRCWFVRSGVRSMDSCRWSQERRRGPRLYENLDDSVVIFKVVYL